MDGENNRSDDLDIVIVEEEFDVVSQNYEDGQIQPDKSSEYRHLCDICGQRFRRPFDVKQHQRIHPNVDRPFQCEICFTAFAQKIHYQRHIETHKVWPDTAFSEEFGAKVTPGGKRKLKVDLANIFKCSFCDMQFTNKRDMKKHLKVHNAQKKFKCPRGDCSQLYDALEELITHLKTHGDMKYNCSRCHRVFESQREISAHQQVHIKPQRTRGLPKESEEKVYTCLNCAKSFKNERGLHNHRMRAKHALTCTYCDQEQQNKESLILHIREHHPENYAHRQCRLCQKVFRSFQAMLNHVIIHTGEMPFECGQCGMKFNRKDSLERHSQKHGPATLKCPFHTAGCKQKFNRKDALAEHMRSHGSYDPVKCKQCHEEFAKRTDLAAHMKLAHKPVERKPLQCFEGQCRKTFKREIDRTRHMQTVHNVRYQVEFTEEDADGQPQAENVEQVEVQVQEEVDPDEPPEAPENTEQHEEYKNVVIYVPEQEEEENDDSD